VRYYRDSVTEKSWQLLIKLNKKYQFVLIGGWAVWLYAKQLKSKDINVVINLENLIQLREKYELDKNDRLKKYQFRQREVEVDVYVPFYSRIGVPAEMIIKQSRLVDGFKVPELELLFGLKLVAWLDRGGSSKGGKDYLDLVSLLMIDDFNQKSLLKWLKYSQINIAFGQFIVELRLTIELEELGINKHQWPRVKKKLLALLL